MPSAPKLPQSGPDVLRVRHAFTFRERLAGLRGPRPFELCDALHLPRCRAVHTFGMHVAIDLCFVDRQRRIVRLCRAVPARRWRWCLSADAVWEFPAGAADRLRLSVGAQFP